MYSSLPENTLHDEIEKSQDKESICPSLAKYQKVQRDLLLILLFRWNPKLRHCNIKPLLSLRMPSYSQLIYDECRFNLNEFFTKFDPADDGFIRSGKRTENVQSVL